MTRTRRLLSTCALVAALVAGCGDGGGGTEDDSATDGDTGVDTAEDGTMDTGGDPDAAEDTAEDPDAETDPPVDTETETDAAEDAETDGDGGEEYACGGVVTIDASAFDSDGGLGSPVAVAQSFVPAVDHISDVELYLCEWGSVATPQTVEIRADGGGVPAETAIFAGEVNPDPCVWPDFQPWCVDVGDLSVVPGETYWIVLDEMQLETEGDYVQWGTSATDTYPDGEAMMWWPMGEGEWRLPSDVLPGTIIIADFAFRVTEGS